MFANAPPPNDPNAFVVLPPNAVVVVLNGFMVELNPCILFYVWSEDYPPEPSGFDADEFILKLKAFGFAGWLVPKAFDVAGRFTLNAFGLAG